MTITRAIVSLSFLISLGLSYAHGGLTPLSEEERARLIDSPERTADLHTPGFYGLLMNANTWDGRIAGSDVILPDFSALLSSPAEYQGEAFLIEGKLEALKPIDQPLDPAWKGVQAVVLNAHQADQVIGPHRVPEGETTQPPRRRVVLVYLTHPPELETTQEQGYLVPSRRMQNQWVRVVARFSHLQNQPDRQGRMRAYPVFVGHAVQMTGMEDMAFAPGGSSMIPPAAIPLVLLVLLLAAYFMVRRMMSAQRSKGGGRLAEVIEARRAARGETKREEVFEEEDISDLPDDPVAALETLHGRRSKPDAEIWRDTHSDGGNP